MIALDPDDRKVPSRRHWEAFKSDCQSRVLMEPEEFLAHWEIDHAGIAKLLGVSIPTVRGWFCVSRSHRSPQIWHKAQLAYWHQKWSSL